MHLATQLCWATARLVVICLGPINPLISLLQVVCDIRDSAATREVSVDKKVDLKFIQVNVLKNIARITRRLYVLVISHTRFRMNLLSAFA